MASGFTGDRKDSGIFKAAPALVTERKDEHSTDPSCTTLRRHSAAVSVIIVNWNGRHHLEHCLAALYKQTLQPFELIVVDNGSTDDSLAYLEQHPVVRVVALGKNLGFAGGNLAGFSVASGDYIVLLNNDTKPLPDWLESLVACAQAYDDVGIVASVMTDWDGAVIDTAGDGCSVTGRGFKMHVNEPAGGQISSGYVFSACGGSALLKRTMLDDVGFMDVRFFMNAEDTDLSFRANLLGWRTYLCAGAVVRHRISASQGSHSTTAVYLSARNHVWLCFKCMPMSLFIKYFPSQVVHFLVSVVFFASRRQVGVLLRGYRDGLAGLAAFKADRANIQSRRRVQVAEIDRRLTLVSAVLIDKLLKRWFLRPP